MPIHDTSDISDEKIKQDILRLNEIYGKIIKTLFLNTDEVTQRSINGLVKECCSDEEIQLLSGLVRSFVANFQLRGGSRISSEYATAAILYYYYQLVLMESSVTTFLELKYLQYFGISGQEIAYIHKLSNFLITRDDPYIVEIRRAFLRFNPEPFVGGKHRRRKIGSRRSKKNKLYKKKSHKKSHKKYRKYTQRR
jgi:hypothetical protein